MSFSSDNPLVSNQVSDTDFPDEWDEFQDVFSREWAKIIDVINSKEGALYTEAEVSTFQRYFDATDPQSTRNVYRRTINFGALPNATSKAVVHGVTLTSTARMTRIYGAATNPSTLEYIPLPFASTTLNDNIILEANQQQVIITTAADYSDYKETTVVIEYTK